MPKDYYSLLGVSKSASQDEIKQAFRKLAHQYHPDKKSGDEAKFKEINQAYQVLGDAQKRQQYDQFGSADGPQGFGGGHGHGGGMGGMSWEDIMRQTQAQGGGFQQGGVEFDMGDLGDMFSGMFGGGRQRTRVKKGANLATDMKIEFKEAATGVNKDLNLYKTVACSECSGKGAKSDSDVSKCTTCNGSGSVESIQRTILGAMRTRSTCQTCDGQGQMIKHPCGKCKGMGVVKDNTTISVHVPAGIEDGMTMRVEGGGEQGLRGAPAGDLLITIHINADNRFSREGDNVHFRQEISFSQAALGTKVTVPTLLGEELLKIPAGTQSGTVFTLRSKGFPHLQQRGTGDQLVEVVVKTPHKVSGKVKSLLKELSQLEGSETDE
ncbi:MAG: molecular chaperone DnaJ [Patescibacteria group bacterium]